VLYGERVVGWESGRREGDSVWGRVRRERGGGGRGRAIRLVYQCLRISCKKFVYMLIFIVYYHWKDKVCHIPNYLGMRIEKTILFNYVQQVEE
jgi:hypothetical protein